MGASKQLSNDLKTKIVQHYGLGEDYKKLSQRFKLSLSTVRNIVRKWKTTGTVLVKGQNCRPSKISERPRRPPPTYLHHLAADGVTVHRSTIQRTLQKEKLYGRVMRKKPFLHARHKQSRLRYTNAHLTSQLHFGRRGCEQRWSYLIITRGVMQEDSVPRQTLATHSNIWWRFHHAVGLCGQCRYWESCSSWGSHGLHSISVDTLE